MLFRILKGNSSHISLDITPFHNGWCYFTSDDGKFYIDTVLDDGTQKRVCVNRADGSYTCMFEASEWKNGTLTIPAAKHNLNFSDGDVLAQIYVDVGGAYESNALAAMDTSAAVSEDKSVVLSYSGTGYAGKAILFG